MRGPSNSSFTIMVADANAAQREHELNATVHTDYRSFGDVRPSAELVALSAAGDRD